MSNADVVRLLERIADVLEIRGENPFKVRAYRKAAAVVESLPEDLAKIRERGELESLPGIGSGIAKKLDEFLRTGRLRYYEEISAGIPEGLIDLLSVPELGPKTVALLHEKFGVESADDLERLLDEHRLLEIPGFGPKKEENIRRGLALFRAGRARMMLGEALPIAESIIGRVKAGADVEQISYAGSLRRMRETVGDIDILVTTREPEEVMEVFCTMPEAAEVLERGHTRSSIRHSAGVQVDLRVLEPDSYGAALQYFTGSKQHNIKLRTRAVAQGLKVSEYGVFRGEERLAGRTEEEVYGALGLPWIPPELREDAGEIEAALEGRLPELVELSDIKGDMHVHTADSDGADTVEQLSLAAKKMGYSYICVCDHSVSSRVAHGLEPERKIEQIERLRALDPPGARVLVGAEVDILPDGSLDYDDSILEKLDFVVASIHSAFKQGREDMTRRLVRAASHPLVHCIGHPSARLINQREPVDFDLEALVGACAEHGTALEVNAHPYRLDLNDVGCRAAVMAGVPLVISTDAHSATQLPLMRFGVAIARRGWAQKGDVLNTLPLSRLLERLAAKRRRA